MTNHSVNTHIMVSLSLAWHCYSTGMLMRLMASCFDPDDILWHSGTRQQTGSAWHALAHPESGQQLCRWFELNVLCHLTAPLTGIRLGWTPSALSKCSIPPSTNHLQLQLPFCYDFRRSGSKFGLNHATSLTGNLCSAFFCLVCITFNYIFTFLGTVRVYNYFYLTFNIQQCENQWGFSLGLFSWFNQLVWARVHFGPQLSNISLGTTNLLIQLVVRHWNI